jgi:hypothetical protein
LKQSHTALLIRYSVASVCSADWWRADRAARAEHHQ